jgi:hypothetical protein
MVRAQILLLPACEISAFVDFEFLVPIYGTVFLYVEHSFNSAAEGCQLGAARGGRRAAERLIRRNLFAAGFAFAPDA